MRLSEERISHIAHLMIDRIWNDDLVDFTDEGRVLQEVKRTLKGYLMVEDEADNTARRKIHSLSRDVPEGSHEWEILYKKYFDEERDKKRF